MESNQDQDPAQETLTSLREKRVALENLVRSRGWEVLVEEIDKILKLTAADAMGTPTVSRDMGGIDTVISNLEKKGYYQGLLRMQEYPEQIIEFVKQQEQEAHDEEDEG